MDKSWSVTYWFSAENKDGCFVAGTPVWTDKGLVPIEQIKVGDRVLSQPEAKGELAYKQVVKTLEFEDKEIWCLQYVDMRTEVEHRIYGTGNHPVWVKEKGWTRLDCLEVADVLELEDGSIAYATLIKPIFLTPDNDIGFRLWGNGSDQFGSRMDFANDFADIDDGILGGQLLSEFNDGDLFTRKVFNIEVEEFHTYYVGQSGIWVHNTLMSTFKTNKD